LVFKGRGFYQAREVTDLLQLLALAVDPEDDLALLSVLRSPLGPVSDDALVMLARHGGHGLRWHAVRDSAGTAVLERDDADVVEHGEPHAVRLLTEHAAKGLEFPVVIVPECGAVPRKSSEGVALDPDLGLALRVRGAGWRRWGTHGTAVRARRAQRDAAQ